MYISASIAAAILLTPVLGSFYPLDTYQSLYARNLDARDAYFDAIYAREADKTAAHPAAHPPARPAAAQKAAPAHPASHAAAKHLAAGVGHAVTGAIKHGPEITAGIDMVSDVAGSGQRLMEKVHSFGSASGRGAAAAAPDPAVDPTQPASQRRSIYADPGLYERDFDDLYERDLEALDERDLEDLYERDFDTLYQRNLDGLDERDLDDLYERDIYDLYERGYETGFEDMYE